MDVAIDGQRQRKAATSGKDPKNPCKPVSFIVKHPTVSYHLVLQVFPRDSWKTLVQALEFEAFNKNPPPNGHFPMHSG